MAKNADKQHAFTLAEVLITLGIIGIVAALTIPGVISRNEEKVRETQLKKAYSVLAQVHSMMLVDDIYPYEEFVEPFLPKEEDDSAGSGDTPGGEEPVVPDTPTPPPVTPDQPGDGEEDTDPTQPNINDKRTKELVDELIAAVLHFPPNFGTAMNNFHELVDMYGFNNLGPFIKDYANQSEIELPGWLDNILGDGMYSLNNEDGLYVYYKHIFADLSGTTSTDDISANFIEVKRYQLQVVKSLLNAASYCTSYDKCHGEDPIFYTSLKGHVARIENAEFDNSALKTSDGMYIWLGDINNPQRYFVDINGSKRPNRLGVDVFTFDIIKKETVIPEQNGNCTMSGTPRDGEEYRGLGCAGYALTDLNPDADKNGYWRHVK